MLKYMIPNGKVTEHCVLHDTEAFSGDMVISKSCRLGDSFINEFVKII